MRKNTFLLLAWILIIMTTSNLFAQQKATSTETIVLLKTTMGDMKIKLYNETPLHRDNFIKLVNEKYYDGLLFHRVINNFINDVHTFDYFAKDGVSAI